MNSISIKGLLFLFFSLFAISEIRSQNIGINATGATPNLSAMLDIDVAVLATKKGLLIPRMTSVQKTAMNPLPAAAQGLVIYQTDAVEGFYYNTSITVVPNWVYMGSANTNWTITGNAGTTASTAAIGSAVNNNFIGTTDGTDFVFATNNLERMRILSTGHVGIGIVPAGNRLQVETSNSADNAIFANHTSVSAASTFYAVGGNLSGFGTLGYLAYHSSSAKTFAVYGNGGDLAGMFKGIVGINSVATLLTTADLEVRNNVAGATPVNLLLRQTTQSAITGNVLGNLAFGASDLTTGQAEIQTIRGASSSGAADLPTDMLFYTTPDGSAALTERMRIANTGFVGVGTTPITSLDVNGAYSERFSTAAAAAAVTIPNNVSLFRLSATAGVQANAITSTTPQDGQYLTIINEDDDVSTFAGFTIPAISGTTAGVGSFVYSGTGAVWRQVASSPSAGTTGWSLTGNVGTTPSTSAIGVAIGAGQNYVGTSDAKDFVVGTTNLERMRVLSGGNIGIANKVPAYLFEIGNNLFDVNSTGNVGIGTAPSSPIIHINGSYTSTFGSAGASWGISYSAISNNTTSSTHWGASFSGVANVGSNVNNLTGVQGEASVDDVTEATMNSATGVYGVVDNHAVITAQAITDANGVEGAASVWDKLNATNVAGVAANLNFSGASVNTNAYLFRGVCNAGDISAGTITNLYGINIPVLSKTGGTVTTAYGAYINTPTAGTTNYGAYLGGNVGIANVAPTEKLDVTGNIRFSGALMPNNLPGAAGQVLTSAGAGAPPTWAAAGGGGGWGLAGNTLTGVAPAVTEFFGSNNNYSLVFKANAQKSGLIDVTAGGSTFFGYQSGKNISPGANLKCTAIGYQALSVSSVGGTFNTAVGYMALPANSDGAHNTAVGAQALLSNVSGYDNTAIGVNALNATIGDGAGLGEKNTSVGYQSMNFNTTGSNNTASGYLALNFNSTGYENTALGVSSLTNNTNGFDNTAIGVNSLASNGTGSDNAALGHNADVGSAALTNATAIGANSVVSASNTIVLGATTVTQHQFSGALMPRYGGVYNAGTIGQVLTSQGAGVAPQWAAVGALSNWTLTGNAGTTASTSAIGVAVNNNFIGTTDAKDFVLASNNLERMRIASAGNIGFGTTTIFASDFMDINPNGMTGVAQYGTYITMPSSGANASTGLRIDNNNVAQTGNKTGVWSQVGGNDATANTKRAYYGQATGTAGLVFNGGRFEAIGTAVAGSNYGVYGYVSGAASSNYALFGEVGTAATNNYALGLKDGHIKSTGTSPTITAVTTYVLGSQGISNATDIAGNLTIVNTAAAGSVTITFNRAYAVAPIVILTASGANGANAAADFNKVWVTSTTTTFTINMSATVAANTKTFSYQVIETQ